MTSPELIQFEMLRVWMWLLGFELQPFIPVQVEINTRSCTDLSAEPFKDKRFRGVVEIGGRLVESKDD